LVLVSSGILVIGVKETVRLGVLFTLIEVAGLLLVTTVSVRFWGGVDYFEMPEGIGGVFRATTLIFFAYLGFEELASLSEEAKNPRRMIPLAVLLAIGLTTILYLAVSVSSVSVIDGQTLRESDAPLSDVVRVAANPGIASTLSIIALFATANTVLFLLLASSRMMYGMASTGNLPRALSLVHPRKKTPWVATIVAGAFGIGFTMIGDIETVAQLTNFAVLVAFVMVNSSLVWLRFSRSDLTPQFRVPLNIGRLPIPGLIGIGTSLFMLANIRPGLLIAGVAVAGVGVVFPFFWKSQTPTADAEVAADPR
ncbi:MAG: APC family permease, partial [SAR202 cluster bacterium]|nr:APC family permease [SAR202 cluster bacterium]